MTQPSLLELAKQGNPNAIATLLNRSLQTKGITTKATVKNGCLHILVESVNVPKQEAVVTFIHSAIDKLGIVSFEVVKISGRKTGEHIPAWSEDIELIEPPNLRLLDNNVSSDPTGDYSRPEVAITNNQKPFKSMKKYKNLRFLNNEKGQNDKLKALQVYGAEGLKEVVIDLHCPHCDQIDRVQKVSAVHNSGYSSTEVSGKSEGKTYDGYRYGGISSTDASINLEGSSQTKLSYILAPPKPPVNREASDREAGLGCSVFALIILIIGASFQWSWIIGIGVLSLVPSVMMFLNPKVTPPDEKEKYNKAISIWNRLFYCGRCDIVYDPQRRAYCSSNHMSDLY
ncbi:hypothetical protein Cri9333_1310 [Crinalium epipsammum PCC 9333]|uniref:Uncharacterized protein n=1 Tax=Crinalium epipsammum PCC 9333 TaxID=1173022 RepID=K9VVS0_9CYAN|nr:hypothetical protein [Crinalium epipsammum]AFZ12208.1 hypothetical protein Cri9333_1310 [Crinalium epipsammum PCC 9333]